MLFIAKTVQIDATIANISTEIDELQSRIDFLRNEKLQLEQYLQQLGSAESAAESAIEQVKTALSMIRAVTGDSEIQVFKDAIDNLFSREIPMLPPAEDDPASPTPNDNDPDGGEFPGENGNGHNGHTSISPETLDTGDFVDYLTPDVDSSVSGAECTNPCNPDSKSGLVGGEFPTQNNGNGHNGHGGIVKSADLEALTLKDLRQLLKSRSLSAAGSKSQLINRLLATGITPQEISPLSLATNN